MPSKLLITGARGMLGSALAKTLAEKYAVTATDKTELDIVDAAAVEALIAELQPEYVVNAAAYTAVDRCESEPDAALAVNATGVANLAKACQVHSATLVHFSTDYVFDGRESTGYTEDAKPNPLGVYGRTKLAGETAILASGCEHIIIRTSWLFGPGGPNFVETMLKLGRAQPSVAVVNDQTGCPTYTVDLAAAVLELLQSKARGVYHRTNAGEVTWHDFAQEIYRLAKMETVVTPLTTAELARPAPRPQYSTLHSTKLAPLRPWQAALADYLTQIL